jgi:hypothetical protein
MALDNLLGTDRSNEQRVAANSGIQQQQQQQQICSQQLIFDEQNCVQSCLRHLELWLKAMRYQRPLYVNHYMQNSIFVF